jgi:protein-L-isoaspartate(D-aspartate) O-methyltransferase
MHFKEEKNLSESNWNKGSSRKERERMVRSQIESRGITDRRVLEAMRSVPREAFIPDGNLALAYRDGPLPIGRGQTISQPYIVAYMTDQLSIESTDRVLEIGTGCGYQTAVLAELAEHVYTMEIIRELSERAQRDLERIGYENISFRIGDGSLGWPEEAPFDAIIVTAAPERIPTALQDQLAEGGRMIIPAGTFSQRIYRITRTGGGLKKEPLIGVRFVPMTGRMETDL